jgi:malonate transporter MadL subunit
MNIYGVATLAFSFILGQLFGEILGETFGVKANIGGVGFAMLILMVLTDNLKKKDKLSLKSESGIQFWSQMYIPIIVAMAATQNVRVAVSSGIVALVVGIIPVILCFFLIPFLAKFNSNSLEK